jgi:hypothetical protein
MEGLGAAGTMKCQHGGDGAKMHPNKEEVILPKLHSQPNKIFVSQA